MHINKQLFPKTQKAFTLVEAVIGVLLLSFVLVFSSDLYLGKITEGRNTELREVTQNITNTVNQALSAAYSNRLTNKQIISINDLDLLTANIGQDATKEVLDIIRQYYSKGNSQCEVSLANYGAETGENSGTITIADEKGVSNLPINLVFSHNNTRPDVESNKRALILTYESKKYPGNKNTITLYNTLIVTINHSSTLTQPNDNIPTWGWLVQLVRNKELSPADISFTLDTRGSMSGIANTPAGITASATRPVKSPFTNSYLSRVL